MSAPWPLTRSRWPCGTPPLESRTTACRHSAAPVQSIRSNSVTFSRLQRELQGQQATRSTAAGAIAWKAHFGAPRCRRQTGAPRRQGVKSNCSSASGRQHSEACTVSGSGEQHVIIYVPPHVLTRHRFAGCGPFAAQDPAQSREDIECTGPGCSLPCTLRACGALQPHGTQDSSCSPDLNPFTSVSPHPSAQGLTPACTSSSAASRNSESRGASVRPKLWAYTQRGRTLGQSCGKGFGRNSAVGPSMLP